MTLLVVFAQASSLQAAIVTTGNVEPDPLTTPWTVDTEAYIGNTADGSLTVDGGDDLVCKYGRIAFGPGVTGEATVTGADSTWTADTVWVGNQGNGTFRIAEGALGDVGTTLVAFEEGSTGKIVFGPGGGTLRTTSLLASPAQLTGTGTIEARGLVSDVDLVFDSPESLIQTFHFNNPDLGQDVTLTLDVTDPNAGRALGVGYQDAATLAVRGMGLSTLGSFVGLKSGSHGTLFIDGAGSGWTSTGTDTIGYRAGSTGEVTVRGTGATWTGKTCIVGRYGNGSVMVAEGGSVSNKSGLLGYDVGSTGTVTVRGAGSRWSSSGSLEVGRSGNGTLTVTDGGTVDVGSCQIASASGSIGEVSVSTGGSISSTGGFLVGVYGNGALAITDGGLVNGPGFVSIGLGGKGKGTGTVTVSGAGSRMVDVSGVNVGSHSTGTLMIMDGGQVSAVSDCWIGFLWGAVGDVTVTGPGSVWKMGGTLHIGDSGTGSSGKGTLTISDGGVVETAYDAVAGYACTVTVSGQRSQWISRILEIGNGSTVVVTNGGNVTTQFAGMHAGYVSGTVIVCGKGSTFGIGNDLSIGGSQAELVIADGGAVNNVAGYVYGATAEVRGAGSTWTNTGELRVGSSSGGTLAISDGGTVTSAGTSFIGYEYASSYTRSCRVRVSDPGSTWANDGPLSIGHNTYTYGRLSIANGGVVTSSEVSLYSTFRSLLAIDVAHDSRLVIGGGTGKITNNGTVRLVAGAGAATGGPYTPILAGAWEGAGVYQAVGGTWDAGEHEFFASAVFEADAGETVGFDAATVQRVLVTDDETAQSVGMSFLKPAASQMLSVTAAPVDSGIVDQLEETLATALPDPQAVRAAWEFTVAGYDTRDPAYLSFTLGPAVAAQDLTVWRYVGTSWSQYDAWDLTYDGQYTSFTVDGFSAYAVVAAVPEPRSIVLLIGLALAALAARRK
ncbi:MAG: hypothetical protein JW809_02460 [Pirellulales bacterium]|nr:hypothetical protein [Pirellulales bacterium]